MFKIGDKVECVEEHRLHDGIVVPKGFRGMVQDTKNCGSCGVQYIYVGFVWPPSASNGIVCSICKVPMEKDPKAVSRCTRFKLLEESKTAIEMELKTKEITEKETLIPN